MKKEWLDLRICDCAEDAENTETYREFLNSTIKEFGLDDANFDEMTEWELNATLDYFDDLWTK